ncbi:MAG: hypothetical protein U5R46_02935 [Gammaproteobacteria bacterium]|nr:hypothetical protein [Gammaproteobacteria bacterium]
MDSLRNFFSQPALRLRKAEPWILGALAIGATAAVLVLKPLLYTDDHALGPHASALFVPFMAGLAILFYLHLSRNRMGWRALAPLIVCILLSTLFLDVFFQPIEHYRSDDPWRYSLYAHNMLDHGTLWGSSSAYHGADTRHFVDQPGYRYFLAGMIWLCGGENRMMQLLILLVVLACLSIGVSSLKRLDDPLARFTALILLLAAPYAAKNAVQGLSEWLAVSLAILYVTALMRDRHVAAVILLALLPFIRQNLLLVAPALAVLQIAATRRASLAIPFFLVFLLPLYHNLYYAGEMKLLVDNKGTMLDLSAPLYDTMIDAAWMVAAKLITYGGIPVEQVDLHTIAAALLFAPAALFGMLYFVFYRPASPPWLCLGILALLVGPTLFFGGHAYFPRFVYTNYMVGFLSLVALAQLVPGQPEGPCRPAPGRETSTASAGPPRRRSRIRCASAGRPAEA